MQGRIYLIAPGNQIDVYEVDVSLCIFFCSLLLLIYLLVYFLVYLFIIYLLFFYSYYRVNDVKRFTNSRPLKRGSEDFAVS